jgi:hypothetical protein
LGDAPGIAFARFTAAQARRKGGGRHELDRLEDAAGRPEQVLRHRLRRHLRLLPDRRAAGINTERVDTRVVQLVYAIDPDQRLVRQRKILVGQLLDVFIATRPQ